MRKKVVQFLIVFLVTQFTFVSAMGSENSSSIAQTDLSSSQSIPISDHLAAELLELEVAYDIAVVEGNFEKMAISLREIGIVYFKNDQLKLAEGYVWRSKIIAEKNGIIDQDLYGCALLAKINLKIGNVKESLAFEQEYLEILTRKNSIVPKVNTEESENTEVLSNSEKSEGNIGFIVSFVLIGFALLVIIGLLIFIILGDTIANRSVIEKNKLSSEGKNNSIKEEKKVKEQLDIDIQLDSINLSDLEEEEDSRSADLKEDSPVFPVEKEVVLKETEPVIENNPVRSVANSSFDSIREERTVKSDVISSEYKPEESNIGKPISVSEVRNARGEFYYDKTQLDKLPLWVSGIQHHFKNLNSFKGIRFDFNCTGDFNSVPKNVYETITVFLKSFCDELVDSNNLLAVSTLMVNTKTGLVLQLVSKPIDMDLPILTKTTLNDFSLAFSSIPNCTLVFSHNHNGELKTVVKSVMESEEVFS